jgi:uncharacterized protein (TIGR02265 family)
MDSHLFVMPNWTAPLDVAEYVAGIPLAASIKGVFPSAVAHAARANKVALSTARDRYHAFSDVPLREYVPMLAETAAGMYPRLPQREAIRKLGRSAVGAISGSMFGRILLTGFLDMKANLAVYAKAASVITPSATVEVIELEPHRAVLRMSRVYTFLDSHHVGILEKVGGASNVRIEARLRMTTPYDGEIELTW